MAAWGYEFYLLVLKAALTRERYFLHSTIKFVFPRCHVISSILLIKWEEETVFMKIKHYSVA